MVPCILGISRPLKFTVRDPSNGMMEEFIRDPGRTIKWMARVTSAGPMVGATGAPTRMIKSMGC